MLVRKANKEEHVWFLNEKKTKQNREKKKKNTESKCRFSGLTLNASYIARQQKKFDTLLMSQKALLGC